MNIRKVKITFIFIIHVFNLLAQGENNIWNINFGKAIDFNTEPTSFVDVSNNFFSAGPGTTVSDSAGTFLFYTNGNRVWNRLGEQMENANGNFGNLLKASPSCTMPTAVVPFSKENDKYYIFSLNGGHYFIEYEKSSLFYSTLDMSLDGGLGDVIASTRNTLLKNNLLGNLIVGKGICGTIWVIAHEYNSNHFFSFEITNDEIKEPIVSEIGTIANKEFDFLRENCLIVSDGMMKFSPNYKKLVLFGGIEKKLEVFDFDQKTGKLNNAIFLPVEENTKVVRTGTFSPDSKKLYVLEYSIESNNSQIFQFDFSQINNSAIIASKTLISTHESTFDYRNIELGPDGVIYLSRAGIRISGILSPNNLGTACNFQDTLFFLNSDDSVPAVFTGLQNPVVIPDPPSSTDSILLPIDQQLCQNTQLTLQVQAEGETYLWQDGTTTQDYEITAPGTYWVEVQKGNCTFTDTLKIFPDESLITIGNDTTICENEALTIQIMPQTDAMYQWQDGSTDADFTVTESGIYWVESTDSLCSHRDSIEVAITAINVDLPADTTICPNQILLLNVAQTGVQYEWQDGSTQPTFSVSEAGTYWVEIEEDNCKAQDTIEVSIREEQDFLPNDTVLCNVTDFYIVPDTPFQNIFWREASFSGDSLLVTENGTYHAIPEDSNCFYSDSITVTFQTLAVDLPADTLICPDQDLLLNAGQTDVQYEWQDGSTQATFLVNEAGTYWVEAQKDNCRIRDSITISNQERPIFLPRDTTLCNVTDFVLTPKPPYKNIVWIESANVIDSLPVTESGTYSAILFESCEWRDSIRIDFQTASIELPPDTTLCASEELLIDIGMVDGQLTWQDGSTDQTFLITESGTYRVNVNKDNCEASDSIEVIIAPLTLDLGADTTLCENTSLDLAIPIPNANYEWQDGSTTATQIITESGRYWARVEKDNCIASDSIEISFTPLPTISIGNDTTLCLDENLTLTAPTTINNFQWQDGTNTPTQLVTESAIYWLMGMIDNCVVTDSIFVNFEDCPEEADQDFCQAYLPNSFSPNGDGINDELQLLTDCELQFFEMEVYDRWGSLLFSTTDVRQSWDGQYRGELLEAGVYLWVVRYQFMEQAFRVEKVEEVTVIR